LFKKAKIKNIVVQKALQDNSWRSHITPLLTPQEINEYVSLFEAVGHIQLVDNREDSIYWRWTSDGEYTTKSAYNIQLQGAFRKLRFMSIWKAKAEPKCRFFLAWTLLHKKILTANNLLKRHWSVDANRRLQHTYARIAPSQNKFGLS